MRALSGAHPRLGQKEFVRNPAICVVVAVAVSITFWAGLIWLAHRIGP